MIKLKGGQEVVIISGSKKSIYGTKSFTVRFLKSQFPTKTDKFGLTRAIYPEKYSSHWNKPFKVQRHELVYDSIQDLIDATYKVKNG